MVTISLCMIVKNEEAVLGRCLNSVKDAVDEIIIVDTGSTDQTKEIAGQFTSKVYDFEWCDDFSQARNFSFAKATMDYQMWLDADDVVVDSERLKLMALKQTLRDIDIVTMKYHTHFDADGHPVLTSTRERLFKTAKGYRWQDQIHEYVPMYGNIFDSDVTIHHQKEGSSGDRNIRIYERLVQQGHVLSPRSIYYFARELMDWQRYGEAAEYFNKFLHEGQGWYEDNIAACFNLSRCYNQLQMTEQVLPILLKSFTYDTPRAEICCQIGYYYKNLADYQKAVFWFELALGLTKNSRGFILNDYWDYIPSIELCLCYYQMGDLAKAYQYHLLSAQYKPHNNSVIYNQAFFAKIGLAD